MFTDLDDYISIYKIPSTNRFAILLQNRHDYYYDYLKRIQNSYGDHFEGTISLVSAMKLQSSHKFLRHILRLMKPLKMDC